MIGSRAPRENKTNLLGKASWSKGRTSIRKLFRNGAGFTTRKWMQKDAWPMRMNVQLARLGLTSHDLAELWPFVIFAVPAQTANDRPRMPVLGPDCPRLS